MLIECSKRLFGDLAYRTLRPSASYDKKFIWVATEFYDESFEQWILMANVATGFCVATRMEKEGEDPFSLSHLTEKYDNEIILTALRQAFEHEGFDKELIEAYLNSASDIRMVRGTEHQPMMNRLNRWNKLLLEEGEEFHIRASQISAKAIRIDGKQTVPRDAMREVLEEKGEAVSAELVPFATMKVTLRLGAPYKVYRNLEVPLDTTLGKLHEIIQIAFGWDDAHLHEFAAGPYRIGPKEEMESMMFSPFQEEPINEDEITVGEIARSFKRITYTYDFGDNWEHLITFSKRVLRPLGSEVVCTGGKGDTPWEDCGGAGGYQYMMEVLEDPEDEEYEGIREWTNDNSLSRLFFPESINAELKGILSRKKRRRFW